MNLPRHGLGTPSEATPTPPTPPADWVEQTGPAKRVKPKKVGRKSGMASARTRLLGGVSARGGRAWVGLRRFGARTWRRLDHVSPRAVAIFTGVVLVVAALGGWLLYRSADNSEGQLQAATGSVLDECAKNDQFAREARARGLCIVAEQASETPSATETGRTDAEITELIRQYLLSNPPQPGRVVTIEEVRDIARQVLPGLSQQQIESATAAYVSANAELFKGEKGDEGDPGRGIASTRLGVVDGQCSLIVQYTDGASQTLPAGDVCPGSGGTDPSSAPEPSGTPEPTGAPAPTGNPDPGVTPAPDPTAPPPPPTDDDDGLLGGLLGG